MNFCNKGSKHAFVLLALLPVAKFLHPTTCINSLLHDQLMHACLDFILAPLKQAAAFGIMMSDPLGSLRYCFTPLAAYIVDTQEATMLAGVSSFTSPVTMAFSTSLGDPFKHLPHIGTSTLETIRSLGTIVEPWGDLSLYVCAATSHRLNGVHEPFWTNWPLSDPSVFLPPEILHHWHRFSWDHDAKWCI